MVLPGPADHNALQCPACSQQQAFALQPPQTCPGPRIIHLKNIQIVVITLGPIFLSGSEYATSLHSLSCGLLDNHRLRPGPS